MLKQYALALLMFALALPALALELYVSPKGNDAWSGRKPAKRLIGQDGPFATLERARDEIRKIKGQGGGLPPGGVTVWLRGGVYERAQSFTLAAEDSGTTGAPIVYRAYKNETPRLTGGRVVQGFAPLKDDALLARLDPAARGQVLVADLKAQGFTDYGQMQTYGFFRPIVTAPMELFFEGRPMTLARWPNWAPNNAGFAMIAGRAQDKIDEFNYSGERPARWAGEKDLWMHGYWIYPWADSHVKIQKIDAKTKTIYGEVAKAEPGQRYFVENALCELDTPGEYYIDREGGRLLFWPPSDVRRGAPVVSLMDKPMIVLDGATRVTLRGLTIECARGNGVEIRRGYQTQLAGCVIRNLGTVGVVVGNTGIFETADKIQPEGSVYCGLRGCTISDTGMGGVILNGGDPKTLRPGANYVVNSEFFRTNRLGWTYRPAVLMNGVRNRVANCDMHDLPHTAIFYTGNEHLIELNHIWNVMSETADCGAIYIGKNWAWRDTQVRFNYIHDSGDKELERIHMAKHGPIGAVHNGIYLDDWATAQIIYGNIVENVGRGVQMGGGRDNHIENNVFIRCRHGFWNDQRGLNWAAYYYNGKDNTMFERFNAVKPDQPPYSLRYPTLKHAATDEPAKSKYNHLARNVMVNCDNPIFMIDGLDATNTYVADNWIDKRDPGFVSLETKNYQFKEDSPVWALGFERIPTERIGRQADEENGLGK